MYQDFIKYYFVFLFNIYISKKILNKANYSLSQNIIAFILASILALVTLFSSTMIPSFSHFIPLFLLWLVMSFYTSRPQIAFIVIIFSFGISYCIHAFSSIISTIIIYLLAQGRENFAFGALPILSSLLHTMISVKLLHKKRFANGFPLSKNKNYLNITTLLCLMFISLPTFFTPNNHIFWQKSVAPYLLSFTLGFLIYWWQAQITKSYRRSLELRELESLRTEIAEKEAVIQKLMKDNENLARISHRDNSLISALKDSTVKYLSTDYKSPAEAIATRDKLISNINTLSAGRNSLPHTYGKRIPREFDTGLSLLDDLLHHMDKEALEQDIMFSVHFGTLLTDFVPENISESDLTHTVDDLLKNAFKSTRTCESRAVQLQFYKLGKHLVIEVADNGIPFEVRSLVNMGIEQLTTYEDGSGIGLMDIWSTKENYRATYHLDEYATSSPFSKKISLTFDKKNRYTIRTYRKEEILQMSRRADLQVYDDLE